MAGGSGGGRGHAPAPGASLTDLLTPDVILPVVQARSPPDRPLSPPPDPHTHGPSKKSGLRARGLLFSPGELWGRNGAGKAMNAPRRCRDALFPNAPCPPGAVRPRAAICVPPRAAPQPRGRPRARPLPAGAPSPRTRSGQRHAHAPFCFPKRRQSLHRATPADAPRPRTPTPPPPPPDTPAVQGAARGADPGALFRPDGPLAVRVDARRRVQRRGLPAGG